MAKCSCANCEWTGNEGDVAIIRDLHERVEAGETMPAGECPDCGALAYLETKAPRLFVVLEGGVVSAIVSDQPGEFGRCFVIDYDTEGADASDVVKIPQVKGNPADAIVGEHSVEPAGIDLDAIETLYDASAVAALRRTIAAEQVKA